MWRLSLVCEERGGKADVTANYCKKGDIMICEAAGERLDTQFIRIVNYSTKELVQVKVVKKRALL